MKNSIFLLSVLAIFLSCTGNGAGTYKDDYIRYAPAAFTHEEKQILREAVEELTEKYDSQEKMITRELTGWNYHTDATSGVVHEIRASFDYASLLLDLGDRRNFQQAFDVIERTLTLQDTDPESPSCGVWPYFKEEPLSTKKAPVDYN